MNSAHRAVPALVGAWVHCRNAAERFAAPVFELIVRVWLAQAFFVSGILKAANWNNALYLAAHEYPVNWLDPVTAAWTGVLIELAGSVLLTAGLATRAAALALMALSLVVHASYVALDGTLLTAALLGWYAVRGAGAWSLDKAIAPGLRTSPLPFAASGLRAAQVLTRLLAPVYTLALRLWVAASLLLMAGEAGIFRDAVQWIPWQSIQFLPHGLALPLAWLVALGLGLRPLAAAVILALLVARMAQVVPHADPYWVSLLSLLALRGAGTLSVDALLTRLLGGRFPQLRGKYADLPEGLPRVVIVGAGFGGLACAHGLRHERVAVTLIDRHNYHLFQPLLYQVATAGLSPGDIATPVRGLFREHFNTRVLFAEVDGIDTQRREVRCGALRVPFDYLVIATGASHSYFGKDHWAPHAPGLKRVEDATEVRRRVLSAFERAEAAQDEGERRALLNFLVVGGGPTGVELAGAIAEMARYGMERDFRSIDPAAARVTLVQSGDRILPTFDVTLSARAKAALEALGVEVLLNSRVEAIDDQGVSVNGRRLAARTVLWAAGVVASPAARWLGVPADGAGRVKVAADLSVPGHEGIFCIGDTALSSAWNGQAVPGLAPAAKQGGAYVARLLRARIRGRPARRPFAYRHLGSLATIGRKAAVADFGFVRLSGAPAWWLWGLVHVGFLVGMRNRISVMLDWFWSYLTLRSGTRLITGGPEGRGAAAHAATPGSPQALTLPARSPPHAMPMV